MAPAIRLLHMESSPAMNDDVIEDLLDAGAMRDLEVWTYLRPFQSKNTPCLSRVLKRGGFYGAITDPIRRGYRIRGMGNVRVYRI